jgi:hypothetical protein
MQSPSAGVLVPQDVKVINIFIRTVFEEGEMGRPCSTNGEKRNAYRLLVGNPEGKRPLGRPRRR